MSDFIPFVQELLQGWGSVSARRMFGGHGLYHEGLMFAIVMDYHLSPVNCFYAVRASR